MQSGRAWATEFQNASVVWPDRVRPLASVMVPEIITGSPEPRRFEVGLDGEERRLGVQSVEDRLDQQEVRPAVDQSADGLGVRRHQLVEGDVRGTPGRSRPARAMRSGWSGPSTPAT